MVSKQKGKFISSANVLKIILGIILSGTGFYIAGWVKPIILYRFGCRIEDGCKTIFCNDIYAGPAILVSGLAILVYTFAKGMIYSIINIIRTAQGKEIVKEPGAN